MLFMARVLFCLRFAGTPMPVCRGARSNGTKRQEGRTVTTAIELRKKWARGETVFAWWFLDCWGVAGAGASRCSFIKDESGVGGARVDVLASTRGLEAFYVVPADLALGLGLPPNLDKEEPEHVAAVERVLQACREHG